jgi:hypothetical protein
MARDKKGRFQKGQAPEGAVKISEGIAKEYQARSVEARLRNKSLADALRAELEKKAPGTEMTKLEYLAAKAIGNHANGDMTFKDLRDLQHLLGEDKQTLNLEGDGIRVVVESPDQAAKINDIGKLG